MLPEENKLLTETDAGTPMRRIDAPLLAARGVIRGTASKRRSPADYVVGRRVGAVSRQAGTPRPHRWPLRSPRRGSQLRQTRRRRPALHLSWLAVRRDGQDHRHAGQRKTAARVFAIQFVTKRIRSKNAPGLSLPIWDRGSRRCFRVISSLTPRWIARLPSSSTASAIISRGTKATLISRIFLFCTTTKTRLHATA